MKKTVAEKPAVEKPVQQAVDRLLLEQGAYAPLELLLAEGRLLFADYEAWRAGQGQYLDELLFGDPKQTRELLQQAADYVQALGLSAEYTHYTLWGGSTEASLQFSPDAGFNRLFHTRYCKPDDVPQMDLFMDATGTTLVNGIQAALVGRNLAEARRQLDLLFDADPGNNRLGSLEQLVEATERLDRPVKDVAAELDILEQELRPLAADMLGPGARDYLAPFWRRLLSALQDAEFEPERPELHASYPAIQLEDWGLVQQCLESQRGWQAQPRPLRRYAQAAGRLQQFDQATCCWFQLCWGFPEQADAIGREAEPIWKSRWQRFGELEPELPNQDFPAWSLLLQPAIAARLAAAGCLADTQLPEDYRVTAQLVATGAKPLPVSVLIDLRQQLKALNPDLFTHYLENYGRG